MSTKVTKAVIAAAGRGTRFLPVVKAYPKELIALLDKPNIQYLVEEIIAAGIKEIAIVQRPGNKAIENYFNPDQELIDYLTSVNKLEYLESLNKISSQAKIIFIDQPDSLPYGNGSPVIAAADFIGNDPFVYAFGDDLHVEKNPGDFLTQMINTFEKYDPASVIAVSQVPSSEIVRYASMKYIDDPKYPNRISGMYEKLPADQAPSLFGQGGRFVLSTKYIETLKNTAVARGELWLTDASNTLAQSDIVLTQLLPPSVWMTTGDPLRWLKANIAIAINDPKTNQDISDYIKSL
jgi:UTP--glucose-1-phosphate uridylyltransferase